MKHLQMSKRKTGRLALALVAGLVVLAGQAFAIFGVGDVVFDPTNYEEAVQQLLQLQQQYQQLVQANRLMNSQYQQMLWMAQQVPVQMVTRYRAQATPWNQTYAQDAYGNTAGWITGINTGQGAGAGYAAATRTLNVYGPGLETLDSEQRSKLETDYATVELADGANQAAIQTIGELRGNAPAVSAAIQNLELDSLSSDPSMNTEIAVLDKIGAANVIALRNQQDANKILVALAEAQVIQSKRQRDAEAQAFNDHIQFVAQGQAVMAAQSAGCSQAMMAWRMP